MIAALVLAAGLSRRTAPRHKLTENIGGESVIARTLARVSASEADRVVVVLGHEAARVAAAIGARGRAELVTAPAHQDGIAASLAAGLAQLGGADGVLVCLGDMPFVRTSTLDALIAAFRAHGHDGAIVVPMNRGVRGNPVLWGAARLPALAALRGDAGGRVLLDAAHAAQIGVEVDDDGIHRDLDTADAIAAAHQAALAASRDAGA